MLTLSNRLLQFICAVISLLFALLFFNKLLATGFDESIFLLGCIAVSVAFVGYSYRYSERFQKANALTQLVQRIDDQWIVQTAQQSPTVKYAPVEIDINRISSIQYGDNYLAVITDGNGNGYDFELFCSEQELRNYIGELLYPEERQRIDIQPVSAR